MVTTHASCDGFGTISVFDAVLVTTNLLPLVFPLHFYEPMPKSGSGILSLLRCVGSLSCVTKLLQAGANVRMLLDN